MNVLVKMLSAVPVLALWAATAAAQCCFSSVPATCCSGQAYRLVYQTAYRQQQVTAYRIEYETVCEEQQVTRYRPVWETNYRECRYTVARPVIETSTREERYTVCRPVWETSQRQECHTVLKPVYETSYRTEYHTVMRPVTTMRTDYVDQGCYTEQTVLKPGLPKTRLRWQQANCTVDPCTGVTTYRRGGLYWVQTPRGRYEVQRAWRPNVVARQTPVTTYCPQTVARQVPVQVCRMVQEQVCRTVPYQVCRMVQEQRVRKVPVTTCRMVYEERVEKVPHRVCRMVAVQETIRVPRCVEKRIPVTYTYYIPRVTCCYVPIDPCGNIIPTCCPTSPTTVVSPSPAAVQPSNTDAAPTVPLGTTPQPLPAEEPAQQPETYPSQGNPST